MREFLVWLAVGYVAAFIVLGVACAIDNWRNGVDVGSDR